MSNAIDFHAHWIAPELAKALRRRRSQPTIVTTRDGDELVTWLGRRPLRSLCDLDARRATMAREGIAMQVLSLPGLFGIDCLPSGESLPLVSTFNDAAAALSRADPERFVALAALPIADIEASCRELERAHALGMRGAILPADGFVARARAERFRPLFETGSRLRTHFFIHPGPLRVSPNRGAAHAGHDQEWQRWIVLETQARLSQVMVTLNLTDYLDAYQGVSVQVANLGGTIAFLVERMDLARRCGAEPLPSANMRRCYVDTASFGPRAIETAAACFGVERLLFGSDCPVFDLSKAQAAIEATGLDDRSRDWIRAGNARQILGDGATDEKRPRGETGPAQPLDRPSNEGRGRI